MNLSDATSKQRAMIQMVFPLADALHMPLKLRDADDKFSIALSGDFDFNLPLNSESDLLLKPEIKSSFVSKKESWVLLKIRQDLWVWLLYLKNGSTLQLALVNQHKCFLRSMDFSGCASGTVLKKLGPGIIATFMRSTGEGEWKRVTDPVDEGFVELPEGHRESHPRRSR